MSQNNSRIDKMKYRRKGRMDRNNENAKKHSLEASQYESGSKSLGLKSLISPDWGGSVGWASSCKPKGRCFNSQSGHMSGLGPGPQLGICERQPIDVSLPVFPLLPFSLKIKINKIFKNKIKIKYLIIPRKEARWP